MPKDILVRLKVPFQSRIDSVPTVIFNRWLPVNEDDALVFAENDLQLKIWFDITCASGAFPIAEDELSRLVNVPTYRVFVDVTLKDMPDDLAAFILAQPEEESASSNELGIEYERLGERLMETAIRYVNRLISYVRNEKGQYWLEQYVFDRENVSSHNVAFEARARIVAKGTDWFPWKPTRTGVVRVSIRMGDDPRYLRREEWQQIPDFLASKARPNLVLELLANAESLAATGHRRSALIEAVTALEIAVNRFSESPRLNEVAGSGQVDRFDIASLHSQVRHLGFSATVRYLLPLLLSEEALPKDLLSICWNAIATRANVVHQGQRDVDEGNLLPMVQAVRQVCEILIKYTA